MRILVVGEQPSFQELQLKLGDAHDYNSVYQLDSVSDLEDYELIIDFLIDEFPENFENYSVLVKPLIMINTVRISIGELKYTFGEYSSKILGFNGLPSFVNRDLWELSTASKGVIENFPAELGPYVVAEDRVGLVTPRIILMIINEAYFTVQEGTASKEDIDLGMKLGTNYPFGPFEWLKKIGIKEVYETLEAIYSDTKDERYKIAPLLKKEYLLSV